MNLLSATSSKLRSASIFFGDVTLLLGSPNKQMAAVYRHTNFYASVRYSLFQATFRSHDRRQEGIAHATVQI
jgi:hypothetical protein